MRDDAKPSQPKLVTEKQAIKIAQRVFDETYPGLKKKFVRSATKDDTRREWLVQFDLKPEYAVPGGDILIVVDELSGTAKNLGGL